MRRRWLGFGLALLTGMGAAQPAPRAGRPRTAVCPSVARSAVAVTLENERGQVLNALEERYFTPGVAKQLSVRRDSPGRWTVLVQRRWYTPVTIKNIHVLEDACGPVLPTPLTIHLKPVAYTPRIRKFVIFPTSAEGLFVGTWPYFQRYRTALDAPSIASSTVTWTSSNLAVATIDQTGLLRSVCGRTPAWTTITATLKSAPSVTVSTRFGRGGGGMLCSRGAADR